MLFIQATGSFLCARVGCAAWVPGVFVNARFRILKLKLSRSFYGTHTLEA